MYRHVQVALIPKCSLTRLTVHRALSLGASTWPGGGRTVPTLVRKLLLGRYCTSKLALTRSTAV